ncbi:MDR family MFS transporter [Alkalihalobacillus sp. AL-G]|uniref:MDR family MFS transporter n=1 Tax=Alkalihalobacillus sp. AL-G TaxID=2926399 RepID=UPI00272CCDF7|nr:MDR family MFS transporter [Alkalihalobacillus sp. AL-G]WLD94977.1 MFS transporter [Alkalihalobacillus sp. AL-G]
MTKEEIITRIKERETNRPLVLAAVILAMFMAAIEGTIVSTAMPSIVADLGGFKLYSWVFSAYLLMQAVTILIYGKLSDLFGRKPVFTFGISMFMIGSFLCGTAESMQMLIVFRLLQGLGAGAVMPIATTIVGDMYTMEERAKIQGYLASVWGISAVIGPALGGFIVLYWDWSWVFWLNLPLGILAIAGTHLFLHEDIEKKKHEIDYIGALLIFVAVSSLMVALIQGGVALQWDSWQIIFLLSLCGISFILFIWQERRAAEPTMPLHIWKDRLITLANLASLTTGAILFGISSFLPAYVQGVMEESPLVAGFTLTTMSIGWPIASTLAGRLIIKLGFRTVALGGGVALILGSLFFVMLDPSKGPIWAAVGSFVIGVGMGLSTTTFIVSIQSSVDWKTRGVATASNMFMRILGSAIGATLLGGILNNKLHSYLQKHGQGVDESLSIDAANILLDETQREQLDSETLSVLQDGLTYSLESVYFGVCILAVVSFLLIAFLPKKEEKGDQDSEKQI